MRPPRREERRTDKRKRADGCPWPGGLVLKAIQRRRIGVVRWMKAEDCMLSRPKFEKLYVDHLKALANGASLKTRSSDTKTSLVNRLTDWLRTV